MDSSRHYKIALVGPVPPPNGGMAMQTLQLQRLLVEDGHSVRLIAVNPPYRPAWLGKLRGLRAVFRLWQFRRRLHQELEGRDLVHLMANSGWAWHLFAAPAIAVARRLGIPVVVNYRGGLAEPFLDKSSARVIPQIQAAQALVLPSPFLQQVFANYGVRGRIVPNIIDGSLFYPDKRGESKNSKPDPHVVITRNLETLYDISTGLRAFARLQQELPQARLTVAGSGPERDRLEKEAVRLGIAARTSFCGRLSHQDIAALYRDADLMLNPSRADNMPNSLLEALACGVPVVSTDVGGIPVMVEDGVSARLVAPGDHGGMARAMLGLCEDPQMYHRLRENGLHLSRQYLWPAVHQQWLAVYDSVVSS